MGGAAPRDRTPPPRVALSTPAGRGRVRRPGLSAEAPLGVPTLASSAIGRGVQAPRRLGHRPDDEKKSRRDGARAPRAPRADAGCVVLPVTGHPATVNVPGLTVRPVVSSIMVGGARYVAPPTGATARRTARVRFLCGALSPPRVALCANWHTGQGVRWPRGAAPGVHRRMAGQRQAVLPALRRRPPGARRRDWLAPVRLVVTYGALGSAAGVSSLTSACSAHSRYSSDRARTRDGSGFVCAYSFRTNLNVSRSSPAQRLDARGEHAAVLFQMYRQ